MARSEKLAKNIEFLGDLAKSPKRLRAAARNCRVFWARRRQKPRKTVGFRNCCAETRVKTGEKRASRRGFSPKNTETIVFLSLLGKKAPNVEFWGHFCPKWPFRAGRVPVFSFGPVFCSTSPAFLGKSGVLPGPWQSLLPKHHYLRRKRGKKCPRQKGPPKTGALLRILG